VWSIPNVKGNHVEKTSHPCQFPIALAEYFILALTNRRELVVDPFLGSGTTVIAALKNWRRAAGSDVNLEYIEIARRRVRSLARGDLAYRDRAKSIYVPMPNTPLTVPPTGFFERNGRRAHHLINARNTLRADSNLYVSSSR
jgi:adenine-specific DNA-methyltransferase